MKFLITGGAGYIGSHLVKYLQSKDHDVSVIDNFSTGNRWALKNCDIYEIDLLDKSRLISEFKRQKFDGVFHLAAKSLVSESFRIPDFYYQNNVVGTKNLLELMSEISSDNLVFSSTAAIYGNPLENKISEQHIISPISPYGFTKLKAEEIIKSYSAKYNIKSTSLRYFNAAGADPSGKIGECHNPETHLIPRVCNSLISQEDIIKIYGKDYDTIDGTCIRDYVHVNDIVKAHILAFKKLTDFKFYNEFNLGSSKGFSVLEIIKAVEKLSGEKLKYKFAKKRPDEPSCLVADNSKAIKELNWSIKYTNIEEILKTSLYWHQNLLKGIHLN